MALLILMPSDFGSTKRSCYLSNILALEFKITSPRSVIFVALNPENIYVAIEDKHNVASTVVDFDYLGKILQR